MITHARKSTNEMLKKQTEKVISKVRIQIFDDGERDETGRHLKPSGHLVDSWNRRGIFSCETGSCTPATPVPYLAINSSARSHLKLRSVVGTLKTEICVSVTNCVVQSINPLLISLHPMTRKDLNELSGKVNATVISSNFSVFTQQPKLVAALVVTRPQLHLVLLGIYIDRGVDADWFMDSAAIARNLITNLSRG